MPCDNFEQWYQRVSCCNITSCMGGRHNMPLTRASGDSGRWHINCWRRDKLCGDLNSQPKRPGDLDLLTLKAVSESCVTRATPMPILVFLGLSVLDLDPMYAKDVRQTSLNAPTYGVSSITVLLNKDTPSVL